MTTSFKNPVLKAVRFCCNPLVFCFALLTLSNGLFGQEFSLRQYSIPEGLVQTQVMCLFQDSKGFLWVGTKGGISRFDGEEFVNFTVKDGLPDNLVHFFYENREGFIFIGLRSGIAIFKDGKLKNISLPDSSLVNINFIYENSKGKTNLFFATKLSKIDVYEFADGKFTKVDHHFKEFLGLINTDTLVHSFSYDTINNKLWGSVNNRIFEMQDEKARWIVQEADQIAGLKFRNRSLYFYTRKGIFAYKDQIKTKIEFPENTAYLDTQSNYIFEVDAKGGIYFGNDRFQLNYFAGNELITNIKEFYGSIGFFIDKEATLWIGGAAGDGLFCLENPAFVNYLPDKNGMPKNVWSIVEDKHGKIWFGGYNEGIVLLDEQRFTRYGFPKTKKPVQTICPGGILTKNGEALFTTNYEVFSWDGKDFAEFLSEEETWGAALIIFEDTINHKLLFGTGGGDLTIKYPDGKVEILKPTKPKNALSIVSISMDEKNRYWCGYFRGMTIVDGEKYSMLPNEECDYNLGAICQYRDKYGTLWVGNETGLYAIRGKSFRQVGVNIFPSTVTSLASLGTDSLIVGAINGLGIVNIKAYAENGEERITFFDKSNGFHGIEVAQNCITRDSKGKYWIATSDRVVRFDPKKLSANTVKPNTFFKSFEILNDSMQWIPLANDFEAYPGISLSWLQNNLKIGFGATSLRFPEKVKFTWFLEGNDKNWSTPTAERSAVYTNLKPGDYTLLLKASNFDGIFNDEPVSLQISIRHAWWQTMAFMVSALIILVGTTVFLSVFYTNRRRNRLQFESEREKRLTQLRLLSLQNQMDPHFTFNVLNSISAVIMSEDRVLANSFLARFSVLIRNILESSDKITRSLENEIDFVKNYLELQRFRYKNRFDFSIETEEALDITMPVPKMIIQTYAENAVKHGLFPLEKQGNLTIRISETEKFLTICVEDNGIGRKKAAESKIKSTGKGMKIMKQYFEVFNERNQEKITFEIVDMTDENLEACGTKVIIKIPVSMRFEI
jgi:ligand-binding sensor domain-containing protein